MQIPFDPSELWTNDPNAGGPPPVADDSRGRRRRYIGSMSMLFFIHLPTIHNLLRP